VAGETVSSVVELKILAIHMGGVDNVSQRKRGNDPLSSAVAGARRVALQAGGDFYLLRWGKRCPVWGSLWMLLPSSFGALMRLIRQGELTCLLINENVASGATPAHLVQSWKLDRC
jgi:hypothetical protein